MRTVLILVALAALAFLLPRLLRRLRGAPEVETWAEIDDLAAQLGQEAPPFVADVRGPDEFSGALGHIPGALNVPLDELPRRIDEFEAARQRSIVLVCKTDRRSAAAAKLLRERGFEDVSVLRGGMEAWSRRAS